MTQPRVHRVRPALAAAALAVLMALGAPGSAGAATATIDFTPKAPTTGETVTFTANALNPGDTAAWSVDDSQVFDNGNGSTFETSFATRGFHTVTLQVTDEAGSSATGSVTLFVDDPPPPSTPPPGPAPSPPPANVAPVASFSFRPTSPTVGADVRFTSTSTDSDGRIALTRWDLDNDGQFDDASGTRVARAFAVPGSFTVSVLIRDDAGAEETASQIVTVNQPPSASFSMTPSPAPVGANVTFVSTASDADGQVAAQAWDLDGDGNFDDGSDPVATTAYPTAGTQVVRLRVTDDRGATATATASLTVVADQAPVAAFGFLPQAPKAGDAVNFVSASSDPDGSISRLAWDLDGDGRFNDAVGPSATRVFDAAGTYTVGLAATDDRGVTSTASQTIVVAAAGVAGAGTAPPATGAPARPAAGTTGGAIAPALRSGGLAAAAVPGVGRLVLLSPFPVVRIRGVFVRGGVRIQLLSVRAAAGTTVEVRCAGRTCPVRRVVRKVSKSGAVRFPTLERRLRAGVILEVRVTRSGRIGKYTRFTIRARGAPARRDLCLLGSRRKPSPCPVQ